MRLLVVSHPAVLAVNQLPYAALRAHGWDPIIVTPGAWRHEYSPTSFPPEVLPELDGRIIPQRIVLAGRVQRHAYLTRPGKLVERVNPDVAFLEAEPTSAAAFQWGRSLASAGVPFGVQVAENLERSWPIPALAFRRWTLSHASFVAARSPGAAALVGRVQPQIRTRVVPHHVPSWTVRPRQRGTEFVVGFAGRFVPEKGLTVLVDAVAGLEGVTVRLVGNGPQREALQQRAEARSVRLEVDTSTKHEQMGTAYAGFDVLVLPSLSTPTWVEQFGRVLVEALSCHVPVIGSDSGEIPWVINATGGGLVVPEGDEGGLRSAIERLRDSDELRRSLAERGYARARELFSVEAVGRELDQTLRETCDLALAR